MCRKCARAVYAVDLCYAHYWESIFRDEPEVFEEILDTCANPACGRNLRETASAGRYCARCYEYSRRTGNPWEKEINHQDIDMTAARERSKELDNYLKRRRSKFIRKDYNEYKKEYEEIKEKMMKNIKFRYIRYTGK